MTFIVQDNIPVPDRRYRFSGQETFRSQVRKLQIGQMLFKEEFNPDLRRQLAKNLQSSIHRLYADCPECQDWRFTVRTLENGVGVWRIAHENRHLINRTAHD